MASKSIGSLFIDIEARTAKMEEGMAKIKSQLGGATDSVNQHGNAWSSMTGSVEAKIGKFSLAVIGIRTVVASLGHEFRDVAMNIEDVKGLSPDVISSVQELRHNVAQSKGELDQAIARIESWFAMSGKFYGAAAGLAATAFASDSSDKSQGRLSGVVDNFFTTFDDKSNGLSPDELARDRDPSYDAKYAAAKEQLTKAREHAAMATADEAQKIQMLRGEAEKELAGFNDENKTLLDKAKIMTDVVNLTAQADEKHAKLESELAAAQDRAAKASESGNRIRLTTLQQIDLLTNQVNSYRSALGELDPTGVSKDDSVMEKKIQLNNQMTDAENKRNEALKKQKDAYVELGNAISQDFTDGIMKGEGFNNILHKIGASIDSEIMKRLITAPLGGMLSSLIGGAAGSIGSYFGGSGGSDGGWAVGSLATGGHAMGGPVNEPTMVGELGPELFIPPSGGGTIIPNNQMGGGGSSSGDGVNIIYNISSGVTRNDLAPILENHAKKIKGDLADSIRRGGARGRSFGG